MKFFIPSTDGIFVLFICFLLVSAGYAASNSTTESPCHPENGCNTTETGTLNSETSTFSISNTTVFSEDNTTLCPQNGCQTESPTLQTTAKTTDANVSLITESADAINSSESVNSDESTTVAYVNRTEEVETELIDIAINSSESETTITQASTQSPNRNDSSIDVTITPDEGNSTITRTEPTSTHVEMDNSTVTWTEPASTRVEMDNSTITTVMNAQYNSSEINITTDTSSEISNYTEIPETNTSDASITEIFTQDTNSTTNASRTDFVAASTTETLIVDTNITADNTSVTEIPLFVENVTSEATTETKLNETTETAIVKTTEDAEDLSNRTGETLDVSNVTTTSDHPTTESVTNYTTVVIIDDLPTVTPHRNYLTVEIQINCSNNEERKEISASLAEFLNTTLKDPNECTILRNITLTVPNEKVEFLKISQFLMEKYPTIRLVRIWSNSRDFNLTTDTVAAADDVTEREVILYVSLGVCLGIVLLLAVIIICFKCLRKKSTKPLDLDVPHLNLRLEDYTLTRIPRPNTVYLDYYRGPIINDRYSSAPLSNSVNSNNSERGLIQPFDTSVVPLEDAKKLEELGAPVTRNETNCPATPLRTFGRKDWKNGDGLIYENIMSSSTEKLHSDFFKSGHRGEDNPSFAA